MVELNAGFHQLAILTPPPTAPGTTGRPRGDTSNAAIRASGLVRVFFFPAPAISTGRWPGHAGSTSFHPDFGSAKRGGYLLPLWPDRPLSDRRLFRDPWTTRAITSCYRRTRRRELSPARRAPRAPLAAVAQFLFYVLGDHQGHIIHLRLPDAVFRGVDIALCANRVEGSHTQPTTAPALAPPPGRRRSCPRTRWPPSGTYCLPPARKTCAP